MSDSPLFSPSSNTAHRDASQRDAPPVDEFGAIEASRVDLDGQSVPQSTLEAASKQPAPAIIVTIPANAEYVRVVRLAVTGVASRMSFSFDEVEDIKLAVSEACNNAILHAEPRSRNAAAASVTVKLMPHADSLEITVSDEGYVPPPGLPLPPLERAAPLAQMADGASSDLPESGLGLLLIQLSMDEVTHHTGAFDRTTVRMVKRTSRR